MSSSDLELFISMPTEDSPFLMAAALLSTVRGLHQYIHHQGTKCIRFVLFKIILFVETIRGTCPSVEILKGYMVRKTVGRWVFDNK